MRPGRGSILFAEVGDLDAAVRAVRDAGGELARPVVVLLPEVVRAGWIRPAG